MDNIIGFETGQRLHDEMQSLSLIPGGKRAFRETEEFAGKMRNVCNGLYGGYEPIITFRGPALSSLIAYQAGITADDPIKHGFAPWLFYERMSVIEFNFNLPVRAQRIIYDYDLRVPDCVKIYTGRDASVIETVSQMRKSDIKPDITLPDRKYLLEENSEIKHFFNAACMGKREYLKYLNGYDSEFVPHVFEVLDFLYEIGKLPGCLEELAKLDGFLHCNLTNGNYLSALKSAWECSTDGDLYGNLIAFTDDVYYALRSTGCDEWQAKSITRKVKNFSSRLDPEDRVSLEFYCGYDFLLQASFIRHLYCRSQCLQSALLESWLMYLVNHYPKTVRQAYESIFS